MTNKDLLYSTENYTQCFATIYKGKEFEKVLFLLGKKLKGMLLNIKRSQKQTYQVNDFCTFLCMGTEKAMAPHSSTLAWKIPWMEDPGRLQSMGVAKSWT